MQAYFIVTKLFSLIRGLRAWDDTLVGDWCPRFRYATLLRVCRNYAFNLSMTDETGFYAPSMAHNALPGRPWPGISVFLGHNSTVSMQLRYSPARECVCAAGCPALTPLTLWQYFTIYDLRFFSYWLVASLTPCCQACVWKLFFGGILRYLMMTINICVSFQIHQI